MKLLYRFCEIIMCKMALTLLGLELLKRRDILNLITVRAFVA